MRRKPVRRADFATVLLTLFLIHKMTKREGLVVKINLFFESRVQASCLPWLGNMYDVVVLCEQLVFPLCSILLHLFMETWTCSFKCRSRRYAIVNLKSFLVMYFRHLVSIEPTNRLMTSLSNAQRVAR
jgi:hypothetical protein